ncbi:MAG: hypothetical protein NVS4B6_08890 [Mycobacterium sp.]
MNRNNKITAAVTAALATGAIGGGIAVANATPTTPPPPPPPTTQGDLPDIPGTPDVEEPGDTPDAPGAPDTDDVQGGDQNGPEVPDTPAPTPPGR